MTQQYIYIPGNVPSLKNSKEIITIPFKGQLHLPVHERKTRAMLIPSKRHQKYERDTAPLYRAFAKEFRKLAQGHLKPLKVGFYFVRDSRRLFDFGNAMASCEDIMETREWIPSDDCNQMMSIPLGYHVDKETAGVYITVLPDDFVEIELPKGCQVYRTQELDI